MIADYDDDTHFCLKCHSTILGLDNYVNHRKTGCSKNVVDLPKSPLPSQLLPPDDSFNLKADDFFSSLELQSSTKKLAPSSSGKNFSGILTRSKTTAAIQASTPQKDNQEIPQSKSGKNVWIGGHQLKLGYGDNQSKLIKAVDNLERRKEDPPKIGVYEESDVDSEDYDFDVDESSEDDNHDAPPRNHTGGKWKPSSPIQWNRPQDWSVPPPTYTGGKWKPSTKRASPPPSHTKGKWKPSYPLSPKDTYDFPPPTFTGSKWSQSKARHEYDVPPSNHTKGKWKPEDEPKEDPVKLKAKTKKDSDNVPPPYSSGKWKPASLDGPSPSYTKGKWIPEEIKKNATKITDDSPFRKSSGTVQYWCRPCNRRLASKVVYERHLKSELHFKRTLHDKDFDDNLGLTAEKRNKKKINHESILPDEDSKTVDVKKRKRKKIFVKCQVCNSKVNRNLMGKHLISHYHCRKGDISTLVAQNMVLENIFEIILQSPFQCGICKFYFNHHKDFLQHWLSDYHLSKTESRDGYYWCSLCKFKDTDSGVMYNHLISEEHEVVVSVINRSVPIIIKKINPVKCEECNEEFLLNVALMRHCHTEGHKSENLISNLNNFICLTCQQVFRSNISLKRHKQTVHGDTVFICTICDKNFLNKEEARVHRNTSEHRYKILATRSLERKCDYCTETFRNLQELKEHLGSKHKEFSPRCVHCGATFTLPQELTVHLRNKSCSYEENFNGANSCDKCPFSSDSTSELLFHKVLHTEPLMILPVESDSKKKPVAQYKCPLCDKFFVKASLQPHLRLHTKERPFVCSICSKGFVRKNNWMLHVRNHERKKEKKQKRTEKKSEVCGDRPFLCSTCGASFKKKSILQQHMTTHSGKLCKCPKLGCVFAARSMAELKQHFKTHSDVKNYVCNICDYRGKTKQQLRCHLTVHSETKKYSCSKCSFSTRTVSHLKRHIRLHTGSKPYSCPHCSYKCNSLENLRKHVLQTNKHRGKCIYECKFCTDSTFQSNFAKEFKAHLVTQHPEIFKTGREAASFVAGIYDGQDDCTEFPVSSEEEEDEAKPEEKERGQPKIIVLQNLTIPTGKDPVVAASTTKDTIEEGSPDEIFPMFIVSKDETVPIDNMTETWNVVGSYDVEESGALVPFNSDNVLFQGHF